MKPYIICLMITSPDGGLHPSKWTKSPDGTASDWSSLYENTHKELGVNAWMVGRVTMAEISKAASHPPERPFNVDRTHHLANPDASSFAIAVDPSAKLHFDGGEIYGDHVVVLLGADVADSHLAELKADGVSYLVSEESNFDIAAMVTALGARFGVKRILLEGGSATNGYLMASGLVDELSFVVAPALDARKGADRVVEYGQDGLAGKAELSLISCHQLEFGAVHLRYAVHYPS